MTPQEQARYRLLRLIEQQPEITQRELARALGVSVGKINYLINALVAKGLVKIGNFQRADDKLNKIAYLITPAGLRNRMALTQDYIARKRAEYDALRAELDALERELEPAQPGAVRPQPQK